MPSLPHSSWLSPDRVPGLVSVVIPTLNRGPLLDEAIRSVWTQTYRPVEVIVVDNGSKDDTVERSAAWRARASDDPCVDFHLAHEARRGVTHARNRGLEYSRGEFVQFLDSDDLLCPEKFEVEVARLEVDPGLDYAYSAIEQRGSQGQIHTVIGKALDDDDYWGNVPGYHWHLCGALYRWSVCERAGPWAADLVRSNDWEYAARIKAVSQRTSYDPTVRGTYRIHKGEQLVNRGGLEYARAREIAIERVVSIVPPGPEGESARAGLARHMLLAAVVFRESGAATDSHRCLARARAIGSLTARNRIVAAGLPWLPGAVIRGARRLRGR